MLKSRDLSRWLELKNSHMERLWKERLVGYLDPGVERFLELFNKPTLLMTTSSCTGRITVIEGLWHWEREEARVLYKTHDIIGAEIIWNHIVKPYAENVWLKVTGPIIHFRTPSIRCASKLLEHARSSGFKHSGIISVSPREGFMVEVMSGVQLMTPLKREKVIIVDKSSIETLASLANQALLEGRMRLEKLSSTISHGLDACEP